VSTTACNRTHFKLRHDSNAINPFSTLPQMLVMHMSQNSKLPAAHSLIVASKQ